MKAYTVIAAFSLTLLCLEAAGNRIRLNYLEMKIIGMETSFFQDIQMLRQDVTRERNEKDKAIALLNETLQLLQENILPHNETGVVAKQENCNIQSLAKAFYDLKSNSYVTSSKINSTLRELHDKLINTSSESKLQDKLLKENIGTVIAELSSTLEEEIQQVHDNISSVKEVFSENKAEFDNLKSELSEIKLIQDNISISANFSAKLVTEIGIMKAIQRQMDTEYDEMFAVLTAVLFDDENDVEKAKLILQTTGENALLSKICWTSFSVPFFEDGYIYPGQVDACQSKSCCLKRQIENSELKNNTLSFTYHSTNLSYIRPNYTDIRIHMDSLTDNAGYRGDVEIYVKAYRSTTYERWMPICFYYSSIRPYIARIADTACKQLRLSLGRNITMGGYLSNRHIYKIYRCSENINRLQDCHFTVTSYCPQHLRIECNPINSNEETN